MVTKVQYFIVYNNLDTTAKTVVSKLQNYNMLVINLSILYFKKVMK